MPRVRRERRCERSPFDRGYHPEFLGEFAEARRARSRLLALSLLIVVGGLLTSCRLNLFLLPALFARFGRSAA